jgi:microcystin-dependent protein
MAYSPTTWVNGSAPGISAVALNNIETGLDEAWDDIDDHESRLGVLEGGSAIPTGSILPYGGTAAPSGYLLCNGAAVSRTTYAALFAVLGTAFGIGNGSTTFNLPDLRQRFPLGKAAAGTGSTLGGTGGAIDQVHTFSDGFTTGTPSASSGVTTGVGAYVASTTHTHSGSVSGTVAGTDNPPFQAVNYIVKT